jgi:outer membrane protein assembly factor BamB
VSQSDVIAKKWPGGILSVSANEDKNGIVWATTADGEANRSTSTGTLRAFDATNLKQLWSSQDDQADNIPSFGKFCPPTIANGNVYVSTFSGEVAVYGLKKQ